MALAGGAARGVDLLEDHRGGAQRQAGAAIFLRDQRGEKAALGQFGDELGRIGLLVFELAPIGAGIALADLAHGLAQLGIVLAERHDDGIAAVANAICTIGHRPLLLCSPIINSAARRRIHHGEDGGKPIRAGRQGSPAATATRQGGGATGMKYMFNVPLAVAALLHAWFISLVLMASPWSGWGDGPSRGAMVLVMLQPVLLSWLLLTPVVIGAVFAGGFGWLRVHRQWLRLTLALLGSLLIAILTLPCIAIAIGISAAVADSDSLAFGLLAKASSLLVATLAPLILMGWLAWVINAPPAKRGAVLPGAAGLAALLLTALTGGILGTGMLAEEIAVERATAARYQKMDDERDAATHSGFAKLTDADPLWKWAGYTDRFTPEDVRQPALRRLAARPTLEPDLIAALAAPDFGLARCGQRLRKGVPASRGHPVRAVLRPGGAAARQDQPARPGDPHVAATPVEQRFRRLCR